MKLNTYNTLENWSMLIIKMTKYFYIFVSYKKRKEVLFKILKKVLW